MPSKPLDRLDVRLLALIDAHPRAGVLELSRLAGVARATVTARMQRWQAIGIVRGYGPHVDVEAAGFPVQAFATLEISQGRLGEVRDLLDAMPGVLEAYATTGSADVVCRLAAASNDTLQSMLIELNRADAIRRTTSVVILSLLVPPRAIPLLASGVGPTSERAPEQKYRAGRSRRAATEEVARRTHC
ncbi:MAG: Lrp/AsnC family transcriptional regulator [Mycobacteriales bacterium]